MHFSPSLLCAICLIITTPSGLAHVMPADDSEPVDQAPADQAEKTMAETTCDSYYPQKEAFFGETHLHTGMSFDASFWLVPTTPRDAYAFAKKEDGIRKVKPDGFLTKRKRWIDRPLDWGAVTDHAEYFGEMGLCKYDQFGDSSKSKPAGADSLDCKLLTGFFSRPSRDDAINPAMSPIGMIGLSITANTVLRYPHAAGDRSSNLPLCEDGRADCGLSLWDEMQAAAAEANEPCKFTSFVGYEVTSMPGTNWHRNVIFANDKVIEQPITAIDMSVNENLDPNNIPPKRTGVPDVTKLWRGLKEQCVKAGNGCDVLTIPHNSNVGGGVYDADGKQIVPPLFFDPANEEKARLRQQFEPLVEIYQHKGSSECRWDPRQNNGAGGGIGTNDTLCDFELLDIGKLFSTSDNLDFPARSYVRNVLKDGLGFEQSLGVNPFKLGIIAATDAHSGAMGLTAESGDSGGSLGITDAVPVRSNTIQFSPGGLSVVWAKENTRESIFNALKNRETYGTSGTRIKVRLFGGWDFSAASCDNGAELVQAGYDQGVPMGQDLPSKASDAPQFIVQAEMDDFIGTPLERIQIIKGWVDGDTTHEQVFDVVGDTSTQDVDPQTCKSAEPGHKNLCQIFTDPEFDPTKPAFYYARVLEKPVCRFSTLYCRDKFGLDPLKPRICKAKLAALNQFNPADAFNAQACCNDETSNLIVQPVIQERAWTSPIWYKP